MKKILLSLAAVGAVVAAAAPAAAQPWRDYGPGPARFDGYHQPYHDGRLSTGYVDSLDWKIRNAARNGRISWDQARALRGEVRAVQPIAWRVQTGQASRWETARLERTVDHVEYVVSRGEYGWRR